MFSGTWKQPPGCEPDNNDVLELEQAVLDALRPGQRERFELEPRDTPRVRATLARVLRGRSAAEEVHRLIDLISALHRRLSSPTAAERLRDVLRDSPEALHLIRSQTFMRGAEAELRRFRVREGRETLRRAPLHDASPPSAGLILRDMLDPLARRPSRLPGGHDHDRTRKRSER